MAAGQFASALEQRIHRRVIILGLMVEEDHSADSRISREFH